LDILFEDNHCLAVAKPPGCLSTHFQGSEETLDRAVKRYLKSKYRKPGNVFLGIVQRLDRPVSGVLLFARTSKAAARLAEQFRRKTVTKIYWAVVEGDSEPAAGTLANWLQKDRETARVRVLAAQTTDARWAVTDYERRGRSEALSWLELRPWTGRTHQLRVQLADRGWPIYGDRKYGSQFQFGRAIALHARSLTFIHPVRHEPVILTAELPRAWREQFEFIGREAWR
jgi:23S rRNA pseudouridine1911/1915/1917 synthase